MTMAPAVPAGFAPAQPDVLVLTGEQVAWVEHLRQVRADLAAIKKREEEVALYLKAMLANHSGATFNGKLVATTTPHAGRERIDSKLLRAKYPQAYAEVSSVGDPYVTLSLK